MKQFGPRVVVSWLACAALLANVLLPTALSLGIGLFEPNRNPIGSSLCSAAPSLPGKAQPALLVHRCVLCTLPAALPARQPAGVEYEVQLADRGYPRIRPVSLPTPFRHGQVQARAPPIAS